MADKDDDILHERKKVIGKDLELLEKIQDKEERLKVLLSPAESYIVWIEKILVWEHPYLSVVLLLTVNILFWLATTWRIYCLIGITGMVVVALEMWMGFIWPETLDDERSKGDVTDESWTEIHPKIMDVPELSHYLAEWWVSCLQWLDYVISLRNDSKPKFFICSVFFLSCFSLIGIYIPGIYLSYLSVMSLLLWPSIHYHDLVGQLKNKIHPICEHIEKKLNIKRRQGGKQKKGRMNENGDDSDDSEVDINEFIPLTDKSMLTTLSNVLNEREEDEDSCTSQTPDDFTPHLAGSHDHTDDEFLSEDLSMFPLELKEMPSFDDVENSHIELRRSEEDKKALKNILDDQTIMDSDKSQRLREEDKMTFVSSHFKEFSDEEEDLAEGLSFSDVPDVETKSQDDPKVLGVIGGLLSQSHSSFVAALKSPVVSQTVSSAMSGFGKIRDTVASFAGAGVEEGNAAEMTAKKGAADINILESEFEFLEQEELDLIENSPSEK